MNLNLFFSALRARLGVFALVLAATVLAATVVSLLLPKSYKATASVLVDANRDEQSLSNVFAGLVLLLSRPFNVGETIVLRSGAMGGLIEGTVTEIGITYLRLDSADGPMSLPNSQVLAAAVSRPAKPGGTAAKPETANGQRPVSATPADAPVAGPGAPTDGQQAGPADLGLAGQPHTVPAPERQPSQDPRNPGN